MLKDYCQSVNVTLPANRLMIRKLFNHQTLRFIAMTVTKPFERLPSNVVPVHYDLTLRPNLAKFTFNGSLKIALKIQEATPKITLNVNEVVIVEDDDLTVQCADKLITRDKVEYSKEDETATLHFKEQLSPGDALLSLNFTGIINSSLRGFYRSKSVDANGKTRYSAVTQFAPTDARRAFPCWDEPALKASFDITLVVPQDNKTKALSNMSVLSELNDDQNNRIVKFTRTPIMSTYLVAFVVGEFDRIETESADGVKVGVYTPVGKAEQGQFALEMAAKALDYYREYFGIAYPLNKMDLIAFPDLAYGAMENWGLVSYRETRLLVDPNNTSTATRQYVALVVAHELAHQWFGNLVTMEWWTHLWLNEGFASFIEYLCVDKLFPNYNIWTQFVCDDYLRAMELDGLDNSHPIEVPVGHPSEIDEIFDAISYAKGASVIRMLYNFIGDEAFRKGMNLYLTRHSYKNAQTEDLWDALEEASNKPVRRIMSTWTRQKGFPIVTVNVTSEPSSAKQTVQLHQEKFTLTGQLTDDDKQSLWSVPLSIVSQASSNNSVLDQLFETRSLDLSLDVSSEQWFKLNPSAVGTYRVRYSPELLAKFVPGITNQTIAPLDRLNLLDDLYALVQCGKQSTVDLFKFISAFKQEHDYTVWSALNIILAKFGQLFAGSDVSANFNKFSRNLLNASVFPYIGWTPKPDEPYLNSLLRSLVIHRLVVLEDPVVIAQCLTLFQDQVDNHKPIPADLRSAVYQGVASQADQKLFDQLLGIYRESDLQEEKTRAITSLGKVKDNKLIETVLQLSLNDEVRLQDSVQLLASISANPLARESVWIFFQNHKEQFSTRMQAGILVAQLAKHVTHYFTTEQHANQVDKFFQENNFPGTERAVQQAVETIRLNASILARDASAVGKYLESL